jgi:hypothetical protein
MKERQDYSKWLLFGCSFIPQSRFFHASLMTCPEKCG